MMQQNWSSGYSTSYYGGASYYPESYTSVREQFDREGVTKMLWLMRQYDDSFEHLAREGGSAQDIRTLTRMLQHGFVIRGPYGKAEATLSDPAGVARALSYTGQYDVHFEVRRIDWGLPTYYVCRTRQDYWGAYNLVVEDLYRSKRYTLDEPRFVKFLDHGRNAYYLRLSDFREDVARMFGESEAQDQPRTDNLLYRLGRYVLQGAWHVDQRFSFLVAGAFDLPSLKQVVELSYMCLSCDFSALRRYLDSDVLRFFEDVYPNKALCALMAGLSNLTGNQFTALSNNALACYIEVTSLFNSFLKTNVEWQALQSGTMPLWKLILANMNRLPHVAKQAGAQEALQDARDTLEAATARCAERLLDVA